MSLWFPPGVDSEDAEVDTSGLHALVRGAGSHSYGCRILDVRAAASDHLPGSAWLPLDDLRPMRLPERSRGFVVVASAAEVARQAVAELRARGFRAWAVVECPPELLQPGRAQGALWSPDPLAVAARPLLPAGGRVLDLGCGVGRELTYLAGRGHPGVGVDRLPDALALGAELASLHAVRWEGLESRLRSIENMPDGDFALVLHLRVAMPALLRRLHERLEPGAVLAVRSYAEGPRRERFLLSPDEVEELLPRAAWRFERGPELVEEGSSRWTVAIAVRV